MRVSHCDAAPCHRGLRGPATSQPHPLVFPQHGQGSPTGHLRLTLPLRTSTQPPSAGHGETLGSQEGTHINTEGASRTRHRAGEGPLCPPQATGGSNPRSFGSRDDIR